MVPYGMFVCLYARNPPVLKRKSHNVIVTAEKKVVAATQLADKVPSCPIFFAMI